MKFGLTLREAHGLRVLENRVLREIFWLKRDEVIGEWRRLHNEELYDLYSSSNITRVIKSRIIIWAGNVARMGRVEMSTGFWWGDLMDRDHLENLGVDGSKILKRIFFKK